MAILSQGNYLGGQRIEVHNFRSIESATAADFDVLAGRAFGNSLPLIVKGFYISTSGGTVGSAANTLQVVVAGGVAINVNASESGSIFWLPDDESAVTLNSVSGLVEGGFTSGTTNYVGLDLYREADADTTDLAKFIDANTNQEISQEIPLRRTLKYRFIVSTTPFSANSTVNPIAVVVTDGNNKVISIKDARNLTFRLGRGGDIPSSLYKYSFPGGRTESTSTASAFVGGDKSITGLKESIDAIYTRLWELGGGERWFSPTADRNVRLARDPLDVFTNGDNFEAISNNLHWRGLSVLFDNSSGAGVYVNEIADQLVDVGGLTNLAVGECLYVDLDRTQNRTGVNALTVQKVALQSLGTPEIPGSRYIIAWRTSNAGSFDVVTRDFPYLVGVSFAVATTSSAGAVQLASAAGTPSSPLVVPLSSGNTLTIGSGYSITAGQSAVHVTNAASTGSAITAIPGSAGWALNATQRIRIQNGNTSEIEINSPNSTAGNVISSIRPLLITAQGAGSHITALPYAPSDADTVLISGAGGTSGTTESIQLVHRTPATGSTLPFAIHRRNAGDSAYDRVVYVLDTGRIITEGGVLANNSDVRVAGTGLIGWQSTQTNFCTISLESLKDYGGTGQFAFGPPNHWRNTGGSAVELIGGSIHLPIGAQINGIDLLVENTSGSDFSIQIDLYKYEVDYGGNAMTSTSMIGGTKSVSITAGTKIWRSAAHTPTVPQRTVPSQGYMALYFFMPAGLAAGVCRLHGLTFSYNYTNVAQIC